MLKNTLINRAATKKIAQALGALNERVVFVGGAVVSLYIDDPSAEDVRPTKDIDISMEIASIGGRPRSQSVSDRMFPGFIRRFGQARSNIGKFIS